MRKKSWSMTVKVESTEHDADRHLRVLPPAEPRRKTRRLLLAAIGVLVSAVIGWLVQKLLG
jgi:hypothetical protein